MEEQPREVVVTTRNTASLTLGIISLVVGVLALLFGWVPFLGLLALPVAGIGVLLAGGGVLIGLTKGLKGIGMPMLGGAISTAALVLPLLSTGGASVSLTETMEEVAQQQRVLREELGQQEAAYIAEHVRLYDVTAKYVKSLLEGRVPGVLFKLRNDGDRSLDKVKVTVYFKDTGGRVIAEKDFHPVLVTEISFSGDNKPLKPGYVWQMESGKFYSAKSVPSEWVEGSVDAKVTEIRFSE